MTSQPHHEDPELAAESVLNAVGAVWLAYTGGAIGFEDAERIDEALKRAARFRGTSETRH
jgi:hypothetical protein